MRKWSSQLASSSTHPSLYVQSIPGLSSKATGRMSERCFSTHDCHYIRLRKHSDEVLIVAPDRHVMVSSGHEVGNDVSHWCRCINRCHGCRHHAANWQPLPLPLRRSGRVVSLGNDSDARVKRLKIGTRDYAYQAVSRVNHGQQFDSASI
jgi:hypothetical protein